MAKTWMHRLRLRVFAVLVGSVLAVLAVLSLVSWPAWSVVSVAFITVAAVVHKMTGKLRATTCAGCGGDLTGLAAGEHGFTCPDCGAVNLPMTHFAMGDEDDDAETASV